MAGQFLGDRQARRRVGGIELADMRPTVPRRDVHTHTHDDAHLLVLHRGTYLSTARGMPAVCNEPVVFSIRRARTIATVSIRSTTRAS